MSEVVEQAKAEYQRAHNRMEKALKATPAEKQNWSPSPTARTPIHLVAHAASATEFISGMMQGKPMPPMDNIAEMDKAMRAAEKEFTNSDQVLQLLETSTAEYLAWLDSLTDEQVASTIQFPFGPQPMAVAVTLPADHMRGHAAQLEYLQTVYGDMEWRF